VVGLEGAGVNPLDVDRGDATPISYLAGTIGQVRTTGDLERTILAVRGAGLDPRSFQGHDLVGRLLARQGERRLLQRSGEPGPHFGVLALRAGGRDRWDRAYRGLAARPPELRRRLGVRGRKLQATPTPTGAVLQALAVSGSRAGIGGGVSYLRSAQQAGGAFPLNGGARQRAINGVRRAGA